MRPLPKFWANGETIDKDSLYRMKLLREAGCNCVLPLLGERPQIGPRCRVCNTQAIWDDKK